jgi:hypothetical protein
MSEPSKNKGLQIFILRKICGALVEVVTKKPDDCTVLAVDDTNRKIFRASQYFNKSLQKFI